jgi:hypothetical protein
MIHLLDLVWKNECVISLQSFIVFDFHHAELVLPSSIIIVKPIRIKEDYFKFLISGNTKLKDFVNDPIIVSFTSFNIDCSCHNSTISSCRKRKCCQAESETINIIATISSNLY